MRSSLSSVKRTVEDRVDVSSATDMRDVEDRLGQVVHPSSISGGLRKAGIALVAAPEPFTGIPGAALIAASVVAKRREAVGLSHLAAETRRVLEEIRSLSV
jgi:hypothetical protein